MIETFLFVAIGGYLIYFVVDVICSLRKTKGDKAPRPPEKNHGPPEDFS